MTGRGAAGLALLCALLLTAGAARSESVRVESGLVEGTTLASGVRAWLGVPFAAPPVRELRWMPPRQAPPWKGTLHADRTAPMCLQALRARKMNHYFGNEATSEDCLYLNVWAPASGNRLPVIVWVYGGGFTVGSASMSNYSGEGLARSGVVRVNLSYRLGALGFMAHPELSRESGYGGSGNYGLMDVIAALQWIRRNVGAFGGDPDNVTVAGQSAGSTLVALLQASPAARGLFRRLVGMSGSPFGDVMAPLALAQAESQGLELQQAAGARSIDELRDISGDRIIAAAVARTGPVIDGRYLPATPGAIFSNRAQADVPILVGFTRDESFRPLGPVDSVESYDGMLRRQFPGSAEALSKAYPARDRDTARRAAADLSRDASVGLQMYSWALAQTRFGTAPAYAYFFTRRQPYAPGIAFSDHDPATAGAYHSGEIPYFLRTRESLNQFRQTRNWEAVDVALEEDMSGMLLTFARDGRPHSTRVPSWPAFTADRPRVVSLGEQIAIREWPNHHALTLLSAPAPRLPSRPPSATPPD